MTDPSHTPEKQLIHLIVTDGPDKGKMFFVKPKREAVIGRVSGADLRLNDSNTSARHCVVRSGGDVAFIEDLDSSNGTYVNGEVINSRVVDEDATIRIGNTTIALTWVATEREVPLAAVEMKFAPTLLERTAQFKRPDSVGGSTIIGADQLVLFRSAQKQLGSMIGEYMLLEVVGMGSLGFVFRAKKMKTREEVATKVIPRARIRSEKLLQRFLSECRTDLKVPGAATLLATGEDAEAGFVTMELLRGRSLQAAVDNERKFTPVEACAIIRSVAKTLSHAHAMGIVHRDVKPANILMMDDSSTRLLDLGMGRKSDSDGRSIVAGDERLESAVFTSPELTRQTELDARADIYSLAATLFCILSGHRPFSAPTYVELIRAIRWESPPLLSDVRPDISAALSAAVARAMEKDVAARYATMDDFSAALA